MGLAYAKADTQKLIDDCAWLLPRQLVHGVLEGFKGIAFPPLLFCLPPSLCQRTWNLLGQPWEQEERPVAYLLLSPSGSRHGGLGQGVFSTHFRIFPGRGCGGGVGEVN